MQAVSEGLCQSIGCKQPMLMSTSNSEELATLVTLCNIWWPCYSSCIPAIWKINKGSILIHVIDHLQGQQAAIADARSLHGLPEHTPLKCSRGENTSSLHPPHRCFKMSEIYAKECRSLIYQSYLKHSKTLIISVFIRRLELARPEI